MMGHFNTHHHMNTQLFAKDLKSSFDAYDYSVAKYKTERLLGVEGCPMLVCTLLHARSSQDVMFIKKEVSDDLLAATLPNVDYSRLTWPSKAMWVSFEDKNIPDFFVAHANPYDLLVNVLSMAFGAAYAQEVVEKSKERSDLAPHTCLLFFEKSTHNKNETDN